MRISLLLLLFLTFCSKEEINQLYFEADTNMIVEFTDSIKKVDTLKTTDKIYNNSVLYSSTNTNITSSYGDIQVLLKEGSKAGFFQNDSFVFIYLYKGMVRVNQTGSERIVSINSPNSKKYILNGGNIVLHAYDSSQKVSTTRKGLEVDKEPILLGELYNSSSVSSEIELLDQQFLDSSIQWLDSITYFELEKLYVKPGKFPKILPLLKTAYVNTKLALKLEFEKRDKNDVIEIVSYNIPKRATLKDNRVLWSPKKSGKYRINFIITDGRDTTISNNYIRISKSVVGKAYSSVEYVGEQISEVTFDMSKIYSKITGKRGLLYKIEGYGSKGEWGNNSRVSMKLKGSGVKNYKIYTKALNGEVHKNNVQVTLDLPPVFNFQLAKKEYYKGTKITLDLSKSSDDHSESLNVLAKITVDGKHLKNLKFKSTSSKDLVLSKIGNWKIDFILTDKNGLQTNKIQSFKVINKLSALVSKSYSINVNKQFTERVKISGKDIKSVVIHYSDSTVIPKIVNEEFTLRRLYSKEGTYPFEVILTDKNGVATTYTSQIDVVNMIGSVKINILTKELSINKPIIFEGLTNEIDNTIEKIRWDFNGNGVWDKELSDGKGVAYTYKKMGSYRITCEMETNDGQKVRNYKTIIIKNSAPIAIAPVPFAIVKAQVVTLTGKSEDKEGTDLFYSWDIGADGKYNLFGETVSVKITDFTKIRLRVMDTDSLFTIDSTKIILCPTGMRLVKQGLYCIDRYEYPNKKGVVPKSSVSYAEAESLCKSEGKRLCYEEEWMQACKGRENYRFSYGNSFKEKACNVYGQENKVTYSGAKIDCNSYYGTYSQNGNVAEWTKKGGSKANVFGGSYFSKGKNSACDSKVLLEKDKKLPYVGFRCCK